MTWTIAHQQAYTTNQTVAGGRDPWDYFFDTWLPAKGWTVTNENGGLSSSNYPYGFTNAILKGVEKDLTDALGNTKTIRYVVALDFGYRYIVWFPWDGTVGGGVDPANYIANTSASMFPNGTYNWRFLESDEDTDHWMVLLKNDTIVSYFFPYSQVFLESSDNQIVPSLIRGQTNFCWHDSTNGMYGKIGGSAFKNAAYLVTPNFTWGHYNYYDTIAINTMTDILLKVNGSSTSNANISANSPVSLLIDGTYYQDLAPAQSTSFLLKTGNSDLGVWL